MSYGCPTCLSVFVADVSCCPVDGAPLLPLDDDPLIGKVIGERYLIEDFIAAGGMGRVYKARHVRMSRRFAVKVLFGDYAGNAKMRSRFAREAEAASRLSHPNVVSVVDFGESESGLLYLAMDFVDGTELANLVVRHGPMAFDRVVNLSKQLAAGLEHAHSEDVVHRDFKAENVIVQQSGGREVARIVDFGIAMLMDDLDDERLTTEGIIIGTVAYLSPEQLSGKLVDGRADLYALGVLMFFLVTGRVPFVGDNVAVARQTLAKDPPKLLDVAPGADVTAELEAIIFKLLAKRPGNRYQTAGEVIAALESLSLPKHALVARTEDLIASAEPDAWAGGPEGAESVGLDSAAQALSPMVNPAPPMAEVAGTGVFPNTDEMPSVDERARRRARIVAILGAALLLIGGAVYLMSKGEDDTPRVAQASIDAATLAQVDVADAAMIAATTVDAGVADATSVVDTGPKAKDRAASKGRGKKKGNSATTSSSVASTSPGPNRDPAANNDPAASEDPPKQEAPTTASLARLYSQVGNVLDGLEGPDGERLRRRYRKIVLANALRLPELRREARDELLAIQREVKSADK